MSNEPGIDMHGAMSRAVRGSLVGFGLFVGSAVIDDEGASRILAVLLGVLAIALAFTSVPAKFAESMSSRSSPKMARFWAIWISGGTVVVPLIAAFFPVLALAGGVPMNLTFGSIIVGAALCSLLNLVVLLSNLIGYRSA